MVSLRKRHVDRIEASPHQDAAPVSVPPTDAAKLPDPVEPKPIEQPETESPADLAGKNRLRDELRKMENAEALGRQAQQPPQVPPPQEPQAPTVEEIIAGCELPDLAKNWLRQNPEFILDPAKNERLRKMHNVAEYQSGSEYTEPYFQRLEVLLGLKQETPSNGRAPAPAAPQRESPPRQQPRMSVPVSAPTSRESLSMTTGRAPSSPMRLTQEEAQFARTLGISTEECAKQKEKMERMKAAGQLQP